MTGASKGIGRAIALRLAQDGYQVIVHFNRDRAGAEQCLQAESKPQAAAAVCWDLMWPIGRQPALRWRRILSNMAPIMAWSATPVSPAMRRFLPLTDQEWDSVIHTNLDSFYNVIQPCVMPMIGLRRGGRIITLSSVSGIMGNRGQVNYSAAKAGIIGATKALAIELAKRKITVNCIAPGLIDTGMEGLEPQVIEEAMKIVPMKRMGAAEEVAGLASYLMSDIAGYVTRQVISINGGML